MKQRDRPPKTKRKFCPKRVMKTGEGPGSKQSQSKQPRIARLKCFRKAFQFGKSLAKESMRGKELRRECENKST